MFLLPTNYWEIKNSGKKGKGVFARKDIPAGVIIGDYLGKVIRGEDDDTNNGRSFYSMYYSDSALIYPDPKKAGIHLINHSCTPNCWMYTFRGHTLYFAIRHIFAGEEISVSYLLSPQDQECKPCTHICKCGSEFCSQTMHMLKKRYDEWEIFQEKEEAKTKKEKVILNKELSKLSSYPKNIPDNPIYTLFGSAIMPPQIINDQAVPSVLKLRKILRENGRTIKFTKANIHILGTWNNLIVSKNI